MLAGVTIQSSPAAGGYDLTVVIPTYREAANVAAVVQRLDAALVGRRWHVVFVDDDSPDGTAEAVKALARSDPRVSCLRRIGRRGLAGAVMEGALASAAPWVVVMDADGQHDEGLIAPMLERAAVGDVDMVVASRYVDVGSAEGGLSRARRRGSRLATRLAQFATRLTLTDPMSGFFLVRRTALNAVAPKVSPHGFKVLFDILACAHPPMRAAELPLVFRPRLQGESKLDRRVVLEYLALLGSKVSGDVISPRALVYAVVGATGLAVHLLVLRGLLSLGFGGLLEVRRPLRAWPGDQHRRRRFRSGAPARLVAERRLGRGRRRGLELWQYGGRALVNGELVANVLQDADDVGRAQLHDALWVPVEPGVQQRPVLHMSAVVAPHRLEMHTHVALRQDVQPLHELRRDKADARPHQRHMELTV
jgi:dolichol-phosphate mannosyltransferase